jgi:hypothetical protein
LEGSSCKSCPSSPVPLDSSSQLHNEFSIQFHEWLIDKTVSRADDLSIAAGGLYGSYSKSGDYDAPSPSEFKVKQPKSCSH